MLSWTYQRETEIEITDGRQRMYLSLSVIPQLDAWFVSIRGSAHAGYDFRSYQNILTAESPLITWYGFGSVPGVGTVRKTVQWPREEVQQIIRAVLVAERLRARSEPHILYSMPKGVQRYV